MNIDKINELEKAENYINAVIDNYKQDIKGTLYQKLNQEDVRDFLVNFYIDVTKKLEKENTELKDYRLTTVAKQQTDMSKYALNLEHKLSWYDNQLTKAKNLIGLLLSDNRIMKAQFESEEQANIWFEHIRQAEQFLKENE